MRVELTEKQFQTIKGVLLHEKIVNEQCILLWRAEDNEWFREKKERDNEDIQDALNVLYRAAS